MFILKRKKKKKAHKHVSGFPLNWKGNQLCIVSAQFIYLCPLFLLVGGVAQGTANILTTYCAKGSTHQKIGERELLLNFYFYHPGVQLKNWGTRVSVHEALQKILSISLFWAGISLSAQKTIIWQIGYCF